MSQFYSLKIGAVALAIALLPAVVGAQSDGAVTQHGNRLAYDAAIKCFVANGYAMGVRQRAGDPDTAAIYKAKAHLSFDTALKLGGMLGLSNDHITEDLSSVQAQELPPMTKDEAYFENAAATCRAIGLM